METASDTEQTPHEPEPEPEPEPAIMVPSVPCPTVPDGHGIHNGWLPAGEELETAISARATADGGLDGHDRRGAARGAARSRAAQEAAPSRATANRLWPLAA